MYNYTPRNTMVDVSTHQYRRSLNQRVEGVEGKVGTTKDPEEEEEEGEEQLRYSELVSSQPLPLRSAV